MERHYGMDWLRIAAFGLLILYHTGMVFVHWGFHVKTAQPQEWLAIPMLATNAWRLALLFVVSGYASRALYMRSPRPLRFAGNRTWRLLIPTIFAMIVVIPAQPWVELVTKYGYAHSFLWFWQNDYFRWTEIHGIHVPTWQHLWFVVYLWVYTLALSAVLAVRRGGATIQRWFDRGMTGGGLLALPIAWLLFVRMVLVPGQEETHDLFTDPVSHLVYPAMFVFGFLLAGSKPVMAAIARQWKLAALLGLAGYCAAAGVEWTWPGETVAADWAYRLFRFARPFQEWGTIIALIGIAERFWNRDHRWRRTLNEAVFPFYIIHQTAIVMVEYWLLPFGLPWFVEFAIVIVATVASCWAFYAIGRTIPPLRPLVGLKLRLASPSRSANRPPAVDSGVPSA
ncbi:acyltransferase family protein [Stakelama tenebrarum]|uniref:Acyltransferase family protein n=1 Tax=Stakelama tenebrarum TaxID=2711215 RepID=A0A6G6Y8V9_9SPHN|nr:acyltransferase [Sphingosinithalassobacter tenebrarum]QIG81374.1 acyltransferase family protein [Sphingosinithalassobacter tenebrarum]